MIKIHALYTHAHKCGADQKVGPATIIIPSFSNVEKVKMDSNNLI